MKRTRNRDEYLSHFEGQNKYKKLNRCLLRLELVLKAEKVSIEVGKSNYLKIMKRPKNTDEYLSHFERQNKLKKLDLSVKYLQKL